MNTQPKQSLLGAKQQHDPHSLMMSHCVTSAHVKSATDAEKNAPATDMVVTEA